MSPDEATLLRAVCAAPDDDVPRLVFTDWLDEHGQPQRAEFIRLQCELATLATDSPRRREVAFRCRELIDTVGERLCPEPLRPDFQFCRLSRGFVEAAEFDAALLGRKAAAAAFEVAPIRRAWITNLGGEVDPLQHIPTANRLAALDLTGNDLEADALRELAAFRRFDGVRELGLMFNRLDDTAARLPCDLPFYQGLRLIRCGANPMTEAGRRRLRDHFGDRVSFVCERDPDHLYAFQNDGYRYLSGFGHDRTQVFFEAIEEVGRVAVFDHAGNLLATEERHVPPDTTNFERQSRAQQIADAWLAELGFEPAAIRVKRFRFPDGTGVSDFTDMDIEVFGNPDDPDSEDLRQVFPHWLANGQFCYVFRGDDWWMNREGEITDT